MNRVSCTAPSRTCCLSSMCPITCTYPVRGKPCPFGKNDQAAGSGGPDHGEQRVVHGRAGRKLGVHVVEGRGGPPGARGVPGRSRQVTQRQDPPTALVGKTG